MENYMVIITPFSNEYKGKGVRPEVPTGNILHELLYKDN